MSHRIRKLVTLACTALASASMLALTASAPQAQYKLTVNKERLLNAAMSRRNWLHDERRLQLPALFQAHPDQPR